MNGIRQPILFQETSFPPECYFKRVETFRPRTEPIKAGVKTNLEDSKSVLSPGFFRDFILTPLCVLATPAIIFGIFVHYISVAIVHRISFKTYFATHIVVGGSLLDKKLAEIHRGFLKGLTLMQKDMFARIEAEAELAEKESMITIQKSSPKDTNERALEKIGIFHKIKENVLNSMSLSFEEVEVKGTKVKIDGFSVRPYAQDKKAAEEQKWIIYFPGRQTSWELWHNSIMDLAKKTGCNVLAINYRGVLRSGREILDDPNSPQEVTNSAKMLEEDATAAVNHLLKMGVSKDNILSYGYSLGGGVASTQTDIAICSDRSFKSLTAASRALAYFPLFRTIMAWMTTYFFGNLNSYENVRKIQENGRKTYILTSKQDAIIDIQHASLYSAFQDDAVEKTPPTVFIHYNERGESKLEHFRKRLNAHIADVPDALVHLIEDWTGKPKSKKRRRHSFSEKGPMRERAHSVS